jgi:hypothetical protein
MADETSTTSAPDTVAQQIAALEQRITALPPKLRAQFQEMLELTRNYERCRANELATKVVLPPDNTRWGASAPPPASPPPAEPQQRPSGWRPLDPVRTPYVDACDRLVDVQDAKDRMAREREYRQYFLDRHYEAKLDEKEYARAQAERRSFHKAPGDDDFDIK